MDLNIYIIDNLDHENGGIMRKRAVARIFFGIIISCLFPLTGCHKKAKLAGLETVIGTYVINYKLNTSGSAQTGGPNDGNPYHSSGVYYEQGPYFIDAIPGRYRITTVELGPQGGGAGGVWSGDSNAGTFTHVRETVNESIEIDHTFGQIVLFTYDWYPFDNSDQMWEKVELVRLETTD